MTKRKSNMVGSILCPICVDKYADVCQTEGKDYKFIHCETHKTINSTSKAYQAFIGENMQPIIDGVKIIPPGRKENTPSLEPTIQAATENENTESKKTVDSESGFWPWEN